MVSDGNNTGMSGGFVRGEKRALVLAWMRGRGSVRVPSAEGQWHIPVATDGCLRAAIAKARTTEAQS